MPPRKTPLLAALIAASVAAPPPRAAVVRTHLNDNRVAAGTLRQGVLHLSLEARVSEWHPDGDSAPGALVPTFAETGHSAEIPGPLIRVHAGTETIVSVTNKLARDTLIVHGLHDRTGTPVSDAALAGIRLGPGERREVRFRLSAPGTYFYWGTTTGRPVNFRTGVDAQLTGAIIVDAASGAPPHDRIFILGMWTDTVARAYVPRQRILAVINGRSWPNTERLSYTIGDTVRWHVINATGDNHPMHLHGFYFRVPSRGDGVRDTLYAADDVDRVVTESMSPGTTMTMEWEPDRPGNWLFHCHLVEHFGRRAPLGMPAPRYSPSPATHSMNHADSAMSGLVLGVTIHQRPGVVLTGDDRPPATRRLRLVVRRNLGGSDSLPYFGYVLQGDELVASSLADTGMTVGPPLVLRRNEATAVTVVNTLDEPTAVHWHGIELTSYYDGIPGFSGAGQHLAPIIAPHDSFVARFTPPHAGTFIYHTHADEERQQGSGLSGPIVVLDSGMTWNPALDHTIMITSPLSWDDGATLVLIDGHRNPPPLVVTAGTTQRLRIVNMTLRRPSLRLELCRDSTHLLWREVAKDGAEPTARRRQTTAAIHTISVGETVDFEFSPDRPGDLHFDVRLGGQGKEHPLLASLPIHVVGPSSGR